MSASARGDWTAAQLLPNAKGGAMILTYKSDLSLCIPCLFPLSLWGMGIPCYLGELVETEGSPPSTVSISSPKPKQTNHVREEGMKFNEPNVTGKT